MAIICDLADKMQRILPACDTTQQSYNVKYNSEMNQLINKAIPIIIKYTKLYPPDHTLFNIKNGINLKRFFIYRPYKENTYTLGDCAFINEWIGQSYGPHDHPFDMLSLVVKNIKKEEQYNRKGECIYTQYYTEKTLIFTRHDYIHLIHANPDLITFVQTSKARKSSFNVFDNGKVIDGFEYIDRKKSYYVYS